MTHLASFPMGLTTGGEQGGMPPPPSYPPLQFPNQTRSNSFSFKHQRYCFLRVFRNHMDQKFQDFYHVCYNFWTIYIDFSFFSNYIGEIDHFILDLLKWSDTQAWTYWKVSLCRQSKRRPQWWRVSMLDYRWDPGPTEKVL